MEMIRKASPTAGDLHVDRLMTNISLAYMNKATSYVAQRVFPIVGVDRQSDKYASYTKADFFRRQLKKRAPGTPAQEVSFRVSTDNTFYCDVISGEYPVPYQVASNTDAPFNNRRDATMLLTQLGLIEREIDWATKFFGAGIWGTDITPGTLWSANGSTPLVNIEVGMKTVLQNTGLKPNKLVLGYEVWSILKNHADIVARVNAGQTPNGPAQVTRQALAQLIEVDEILVMESIKNTAAEGQAASMSFIGGKHALLVYAAPSPSLMLPSGGYTFTWTAFPGANAAGGRIDTYNDNKLSSEVHRFEMAYDQKKVAADCGYFFESVVA